MPRSFDQNELLQIFNTIETPTVVFDPLGKISRMNDAAEQLLGFDSSTLCAYSMGFEDAFDSDFAPSLFPWTTHVNFIRDDGALYSLTWSLNCIYDVMGAPQHIIATAQNTTEQEHIYHHFEESLARHEAILDSLTFPAFSTDCDGILQTFNLAAEELLGYGVDELIYYETPLIWHDLNEIRGTSGQDFSEVIAHFDPIAYLDILLEYQDQVWTFYPADAPEIRCELTLTKIYDCNSYFCGYLGTIRPLSDLPPSLASRDNSLGIPETLENKRLD